MDHSDEDILGLYEDLQGIGLSETPGEEIERILSDWKKYRAWSPPRRRDWILHYLLSHNIPHTYLLVVVQEEEEEIKYFESFPSMMLFPVIRGNFIYSRIKYSPISNAGDAYKHLNPDNYTFTSYLLPDLDSLQEKLKEVKTIPGLFSPNKYDYIFERD